MSLLQIYELEVILIKIQIDIFMKLNKLILRFIWKPTYKNRQDLFDEHVLHIAWFWCRNRIKWNSEFGGKINIYVMPMYD